MADAVAANFRPLFEFEFDSLVSTIGNTISSSNSSSSLNTSSSPFSLISLSPKPLNTLSLSTVKDEPPKLLNETINIMDEFTRASYTFGFRTSLYDADQKMPIGIWTNCVYTIQAIGKFLAK
jgi:hypothetical protein